MRLALSDVSFQRCLQFFAFSPTRDTSYMSSRLSTVSVVGCISDIICIISKLSGARNAALFAVKFLELASRWSWEFDFELHELYDGREDILFRKGNVSLDRSLGLGNLIRFSIPGLTITMNINELCSHESTGQSSRLSCISRGNIRDKKFLEIMWRISRNKKKKK